MMKVNESGQGRNVLLLHGGGGPFTLAGLVAHLAPTTHTILPTYPGWEGTPRPEALDSVGKLADMLYDYLEERDLRDVLVLGSSIGGWVAAELALRDDARRLAGLVIANGLGVDVPGHPIKNVQGFTLPELAQVAYHDPAKFLASLPPPTPERLAVLQTNQAALNVLTGETYGYDPTLLKRLSAVRVPSLVLWGEADQIVTAAYGRGYAAAIPGAEFVSIAHAGHLPWLEQPEATFSALDAFVSRRAPAFG
jgi:pimeloyl-ACP methyl ester carboxylesterase